MDRVKVGLGAVPCSRRAVVGSYQDLGREQTSLKVALRITGGMRCIPGRCAAPIRNLEIPGSRFASPGMTGGFF
jgi:hypothetical protein